MPTLLEKAMKEEPGPDTNEKLRERLDLALAYANREVNGTQIEKALNSKNGSCFSTLGSTLLTAARRGLITIKKV